MRNNDPIFVMNFDHSGKRINVWENEGIIYCDVNSKWVGNRFISDQEENPIYEIMTGNILEDTINILRKGFNATSKGKLNEKN